MDPANTLEFRGPADAAIPQIPVGRQKSNPGSGASLVDVLQAAEDGPEALLSGDPCDGSAPGSPVGGRWRGVARRSPRSSIIGEDGRSPPPRGAAQTFAPLHRLSLEQARADTHELSTAWQEDLRARLSVHNLRGAAAGRTAVGSAGPAPGELIASRAAGAPPTNECPRQRCGAASR